MRTLCCVGECGVSDVGVSVGPSFGGCLSIDVVVWVETVVARGTELLDSLLIAGCMGV